MVNLEKTAEKSRDFELRSAQNKTEVERARAIQVSLSVNGNLDDVNQDAAEKIRTAQKMMDVTEQKMKVKVIERERQIELQESEILRKEKQLEATVKKPAEAQKLKLEIEARANATKALLDAEAQAEARRLRGESHAYAIEVKAKAEAENMRRKAKALDAYQQAATANMVIQKLPEVIDAEFVLEITLGLDNQWHNEAADGMQLNQLGLIGPRRLGCVEVDQ